MQQQSEFVTAGVWEDELEPAGCRDREPSAAGTAYLEISFPTFRERTQITASAPSCRKDNKEKSCWKCRIKCLFQLCLCLYSVLRRTHQSEQANVSFCLHLWNKCLKSSSVLVSTVGKDTCSTPQPIVVLQSTPGQLSPGPRRSLMQQDCRWGVTVLPPENPQNRICQTLLLPTGPSAGPKPQAQKLLLNLQTAWVLP